MKRGSHLENKAIFAENLTKFYGKARGIDGLNLEVAPGEFFGFIGPNGAGKSTTIRTLLGLISPTAGKGRVFGMDIVKNKKAILERVGYLPSDIAFYSGMKVRDMLKLSADLHRKNCDAAAAELCDRLQLDRERKVEDLSFGLLVLDEPTGGLDPLMQHEFFSILQERNQEGVTVFLSSHVLSEIQRYCSKAAIIREGKIIACDSVDRLVKTGARRVTFRGNLQPDALPDVRDWTETDGTVSFLYNGETNRLVRTLAGLDVHELTIAEPDLEEIVIHFYQKGGEQA